MSMVIATTAYAAAAPYLGDWAAGVEAALGRRRDVGVVVALDGPDDLRRAFEPLTARIGVTIVGVAPGGTAASARRVMLQGAAASGADAIVFVDADDVLLAGAIERHEAALAGSDISYGDLEIVDGHGQGRGRTYFGERTPPASIAAGDLLDRNFVGFSNAAIRRAALSHAALAVPDAIRAVDWWLFSALLGAGATGQRAEGIAARYRQHGANLLGSEAAGSLAEARHRCEVALAHYSNLPPSPAVTRRIETLTRLCADGDLLAGVLPEAAAARFWHEDVAAWIAAACRRQVRVA